MYTLFLFLLLFGKHQFLFKALSKRQFYSSIYLFIMGLDDPLRFKHTFQLKPLKKCIIRPGNSGACAVIVTGKAICIN